MRFWIASGVFVACAAIGGAFLYAGKVAAPAKETSIRHHIVAGDTLGDLAQRYGTNLAELRKENNIEGETIFTGRVLKITPGKTWWKSASARSLRGLAAPADGFDFPVGDGSAHKYYNAQPYGENNHLGDDWNGVGGGNTDLGDPVLASADGVVVSARDRKRGWGNVVRIVHNAGTSDAPVYVETLYAHLKRIDVAPRQRVARGDVIGTIGTADGRYPAHLHFEIRTVIDSDLGRGYSKNTDGTTDPTAFIRKRRP